MPSAAVSRVRSHGTMTVKLSFPMYSVSSSMQCTSGLCRLRAHAMRVLVDRVDDLRPHRDRERVAHAFDHQEFRAGDRGCGVLAAGGMHQRIDGAVNDQGRRLHRVQAPLTPAGLRPRSKQRSPRARSNASSSGKRPTRSIFQVWAKRARYSSLVVGGGAISSAAASRVGGGILGFPVVDMMEVSERTRCGNEIAISCAIMPPIEAPTRCADVMPSASISPVVSSAMSRKL